HPFLPLADDRRIDPSHPGAGQAACGGGGVRQRGGDVFGRALPCGAGTENRPPKILRLVVGIRTAPSGFFWFCSGGGMAPSSASAGDKGPVFLFIAFR